MTTPSDEIAFGRAFLERAFKVASDPDADANERAYAQAVVSAVKEKTAGVSLDFLLDVGSKTPSLGKVAMKRDTVYDVAQRFAHMAENDPTGALKQRLNRTLGRFVDRFSNINRKVRNPANAAQMSKEYGGIVEGLESGRRFAEAGVDIPGQVIPRGEPVRFAEGKIRKTPAGDERAMVRGKGRFQNPT